MFFIIFRSFILKDARPPLCVFISCFIYFYFSFLISYVYCFVVCLFVLPKRPSAPLGPARLYGLCARLRCGFMSADNWRVIPGSLETFCGKKGKKLEIKVKSVGSCSGSRPANSREIRTARPREADRGRPEPRDTSRAEPKHRGHNNNNT